MGTRGGARPGAGRKPTAERYESQIRKAEKRVADHLPSLVENLITLANGVVVEETDNLTGEVKVYKKAPDRQANEYLINRIMGKPTERQEHSGPDGNVIPMQVFANDLKRAYGDDDGDTDSAESR